MRELSIRLRFGPYTTPRYKYGSVVMDELRGEVTLVETSSAKIPWPIGTRGRAKTLVLYKDLARAVRRESNQAVAYWWGVTPQTVTKWRKALGVLATNEGTSAVRSELITPAKKKRFVEAVRPTLRSPKRRAKIAAARGGKPRPKHVIEVLRKTHLGQKLSDEQRRKMSEAHKRRGTRPPAAGVPWTAKEDQLLRKLPARDVAKRTGRTLTAVYARRNLLKVPDGRRRIL
jgi:Ni/Co efflux regulator RcnB